MFLTVISFLLVALLNIISYNFEANKIRKVAKILHNDKIKPPGYFQHWKRYHDETSLVYYKTHVKHNGFRKPVGLMYKKKPIWLFGCSFVYGVDVAKGNPPDSQIFSAVLSEYTKRPVYNRAFPAWGVQHMLYQLQEGEIYKELPAPEFVIFTFIPDHARRLNKITYGFWNDGAYLRYTLKDGKLKEESPILEPLWKMYSVKALLSYLDYYVYGSSKNRDKNFDLIESMFIASRKEIDSHYKNVKFVILKYKGADDFDPWYVDTNRWGELEKQGFIVLRAEELAGNDLLDRKYLAGDEYHPTRQAWEVVVPELSTKLEL